MKKNKNNVMENYRRLFNIFEGYLHNNVRCVAITSNNNSEGKTIVAKNSAMLLAKNGKKTLYIDCNIKKSSKMKGLEAEKAKGLLNVLDGMNKLSISDSELLDIIEDTQWEHLSTLDLGAYDLDNYNPMFKPEYLKKIMEIIKKYFDCIIIDTPSFEYLSYTQIITSAADGCLFILKEGVNEINQGRIIKEKLTTIGCAILGCIFEKEKKPAQFFRDKHNDFFGVNYRKSKKRILTNSSVSADS